METVLAGALPWTRMRQVLAKTNKLSLAEFLQIVFADEVGRRARASGVGAAIDVPNLETQVGSIDRRINYLLWRQWTGPNVTRPPAYGQAVLPFG